VNSPNLIEVRFKDNAIVENLPGRLAHGLDLPCSIQLSASVRVSRRQAAELAPTAMSPRLGSMRRSEIRIHGRLDLPSSMA
jgi:hypothetical protein